MKIKIKAKYIGNENFKWKRETFYILSVDNNSLIVTQEKTGDTKGYNSLFDFLKDWNNIQTKYIRENEKTRFTKHL